MVRVNQRVTPYYLIKPMFMWSPEVATQTPNSFLPFPQVSLDYVFPAQQWMLQTHGVAQNPAVVINLILNQVPPLSQDFRLSIKTLAGHL